MLHKAAVAPTAQCFSGFKHVQSFSSTYVDLDQGGASNPGRLPVSGLRQDIRKDEDACRHPSSFLSEGSQCCYSSYYFPIVLVSVMKRRCMRENTSIVLLEPREP